MTPTRRETEASTNAPRPQPGSSFRTNRAFAVILFFLALAVLFFARLIYLQVIIAPTYAAQAQEARTIGFPVEPRRGTIYDRNGHILAISVDATTIYANPSEVTDPVEEAKSIASVLGGEAKTYETMLTKGQSKTFSFIERKADTNKADRLRELELPGIYFIEDTRREYPYGQTGGQVIGACSIEVDAEANREYYVGICGLEMYYNTILSGTVGYYEAEVGQDGTPIPGGVHVSQQAVEGQDIVISLDIEFQEEVEAALKEGVARVGVTDGSAVVMDAETGQIYAAASSPFFNPADRSKVPEGSMQLKAVTNLFEPGSIFKTVSAAAILEDGCMDPDTTVDLPSSLEADGYVVSDAFDHGDMTLTLREIMNMSSNVGISLAVEQNLGFTKLNEAIERYRINELTGIDYPGEQLGYMLEFDYWSRVQGYNATFGQGLSVNAMQMVAFYGSLINDGVEVTPHFLIRKPQTNEIPEYPTYKIFENTDALEPLKSILRTVVTDGTGTEADIEGYQVAGKTSTAEIYDEEGAGYREEVYNLAFAGFIDDSTSKLVCLVTADEVPGDRKVNQMFHDIMSDAINRYNIVNQ